MLVLSQTNNITNLMVHHPQWRAPYPPDLILHGEQIKNKDTSQRVPNAAILQYVRNVSMSSNNKLIATFMPLLVFQLLHTV